MSKYKQAVARTDFELSYLMCGPLYVKFKADPNTASSLLDATVDELLTLPDSHLVDITPPKLCLYKEPKQDIKRLGTIRHFFQLREA